MSEPGRYRGLEHAAAYAYGVEARTGHISSLWQQADSEMSALDAIAEASMLRACMERGMGPRARAVWLCRWKQDETAAQWVRTCAQFCLNETRLVLPLLVYGCMDWRGEPGLPSDREMAERCEMPRGTVQWKLRGRHDGSLYSILRRWYSRAHGIALGNLEVADGVLQGADGCSVC